MKQYIELLNSVKNKGTYKPAAREGMPGTTSLFGYQFRHDLADGFPLITTKKINFKHIVAELLWFLQGDTNIKYLVDNGCNIWNEDAYNYYKKIASKNTGIEANSIYHNNGDQSLRMFTFEEFCKIIKESDDLESLPTWLGHYTLGDCGMQYGKLWRDWEGVDREVIVLKTDNISTAQREQFKQEWLTALRENKSPILIAANDDFQTQPLYKKTDQIKELIEGLKTNPMSRRHILTAWNPATLDDMALNACHAMVQFNCRPLTHNQRVDFALKNHYSFKVDKHKTSETVNIATVLLDDKNIPSHYLDCQMYQRSADVFLGAPYNIASYALLTEILAKVCNMIPGEFIHTFGDVHIYDNHKEQVELQLTRQEKPLPTLRLPGLFDKIDFAHEKTADILNLLVALDSDNIHVENYDPHPAIKGKLSTGLQ